MLPGSGVSCVVVGSGPPPGAPPVGSRGVMGLPPGEAEAGRGGLAVGTAEGTAVGGVIAGGVVGPGDAGTGRVTVGVCAHPPPAVARSRPQARRDCRAKRMMVYYNMG